MSIESKYSLNLPKIRENQFPPAQIRQITAGNTEFWQGQTAQEKDIKDAELAFERMKNFLKENPINTQIQNLDAEKIKDLRRKFEENYKNLTDQNLENEKSEIDLANKKLENIFHELIIATLRHEIDLQMRIWKIELTEEDREEIKNYVVKKPAHICYQIKNGKLEETSFVSWIGEGLPKVPKFDEAKFKEMSDVEKGYTKKYYKLTAYQNAVKMINAHLLGIIKTPQEIEELRKNKAENSKKH